MKIGLGISTKLIIMVTVIVITAVGVVVFIATDLFQEDSVARVQERNKDVAESLADQVFSIVKDSTDKMTLMAETLGQTKGKGITPESVQFIQNILRSNDELLSFGVYSLDPKTGFKEIFFATTEEVIAELNVSVDDLKTRVVPSLYAALMKQPDSLALVNTSPLFKIPILSIAFLTKENALTKSKWIVRADLRQGPIIKLFGKRSFLTAYLVDGAGNLLVHSNPQFVLNRYNVSTYPIVQKLKEGKLNNHQMEFEDDQETAFLGAFKTLGIANTAVVAQVEKNRALAAVQRVQYRSVLVTAIVVGLAFILNFIFSQSMTSPLGDLYRATEKIANGVFNVKLEPKSNDEIGALTRAFKKMAMGLEERDKLKSTFSKFHSKEIAQKILSGEIKLGGERKMATVFFSDIRDFTTISESMNPDEVLGMLNEYMTEMVKTIYKHSGVVDKYVGDAIMALWGVPNSTPNDALNAVKSALEMRKVLKDFNKKRRSRNQFEIKIGMGIHTGDVVAGNMGSDQRLEYTVIGDNVNQAARIESANKNCSSDILISDATWALVKSHGVVVGPALHIQVKGKAANLIVHQVIGMKSETGDVLTDLSLAEQELIMSQRMGHDDGPQELQPLSSSVTMAKNNVPKNIPMNPKNSDLITFGETHTENLQPEQPIPFMVDQWYLVKDPLSHEHDGPYSMAQMKAVVGQIGFPFEKAYAFKEGDAQMSPLSQIPGLSRRVSAPGRSINAPPPAMSLEKESVPNEWYIYGDENTTYGPYSIEQIKQTLEDGHITRTNYVWCQGLDKWIYVHQIPGFDRREKLADFGSPLTPMAVSLTNPKKIA